MKFKPDSPNETLDVLRLVSENEVWELGYRQMLFGVRVSLSRIGDYWYTLDYCAGDNPEFALHLLLTVMQILKRYTEDVAGKQLERDFPKYDVKPIDRDPNCWKQLQEMASIVERDRK